ncbi:MFS transporter [Nocardia sp. NPDC052254]|uniref:MFS transporter n=1 Tax=Nocardia sp. NPDC052254 TaxID=3155681 RepID=UPI00342D6062
MALNLNPDHGPVPRRRIFAVLAVIILFSEIATFEILMIYPAMPHMAPAYRTLNIAWAVSIVTLTGATLIPLIGKAADRWGKKRIILILGVVFVLGSVTCALSTSFAVLLAGRAMQGVLVGIVALSYSLVREIMPREFVPIALGMVATGIGMSAVAGPFVAGWLIDGFGFAGIFWFMAIYIAVLLPVYWLVIPESPARSDRPVDYLGTALLGPGIAVLLLAVTKGAAWGWDSARTLTLFIVGALMLAGFVAWQRVAPHPLIDLGILFGRRFGPTILAVACVSYMMNAQSLLMPTLLQTPTGLPGLSYGAGLTATEYAVWTCPLGIVAMVAGPAGGWLARRFGARHVLLAAGILFVGVMVLGAQLLTVRWQIGILSAIAGFAVGFLHSSNANLVQDALPAADSGVGTSIAGVSMQLVSAVAVTCTGVVMSHHVTAVNPRTHAVLYADSALTQGFLVAGVVGLAGVVIAALMRHGRSPATGGLDEAPAPMRSADPTASPAT